MLNRIARLVVAYGDTMKDDTFKEKLSRVSLKELARTAKDRRAGSLGYSETIVSYYNNNKNDPFARMPRDIRNIAVYHRVGVLSEDSVSVSLLPGFYEKYVADHPNWNLTGIYQDAGNKDTELNRLIEECKQHKVDLVIVKSISRI